MPTTPTSTSGKYQHSKTGLSRLFHTLIYSRDGFLTAMRNEAAFRQLLVLHGLLMPLAILLPLSPIEKALMLTVCFISLIVELINSAIEAAIDRISLELHPLSKNAKDMGSTAQTIALLMVATVWSLILLG
ncbi:diacylglycerol kinase [Lampropedia puyangensis]|uniref:Diacylglycerol kinase n=1 Tax=Lampropedia puyangensis TaxID=1330072 RepID=A0A4S8FBP6_9BURK|nr:diacylglycerol kinase [Lampropedia puyangensis]THU03984.1 diacylglycerol kinase [Lampropedia puyangensis]